MLSQTRNGENVKITIMLTNELPPSSPVCLQFYNILFKRSATQSNQYASSGGSFHPKIDLLLCDRILRILNMQQIGRNYFSPNDPLNIPQHKYFSFLCRLYYLKKEKLRWSGVKIKVELSLRYSEHKFNNTGLTYDVDGSQVDDATVCCSVNMFDYVSPPG